MSGTISLSSISSNSPEMATVLLEWNTTIAPTTYTIFLVQTDLTNDASANCPDFFRSIAGTITSGETLGSIYVTVDELKSNTKYLASAQVRLGVGTTAQSTFLQTTTTTNLITTMAQPTIHVTGVSTSSVTIDVSYNLGGCYYALPDKVQFYYTDGTNIYTKLFEDPYNLIENSYVIDGLTEEPYVFSCEIANEAGFSEISNSVIGEPTVVPFPPQNVTAVRTPTSPAYGQGKITVSWTAPTAGSVDVLTYKIYDASTNILLGTVSGSTYSFLFTQSSTSPAVLGRSYQFYVIAVGEDGSSLPSNTTTPAVLFATVPNVVTDLSGNSYAAKIVVTWSPPAGDSGANVYTYDLQYKLSTDASYSNPIITNVTSPYTITTGLVVGQTYNIRVRADNSIGNGEWTVITVKVITDPNPPVLTLVTPEFGRSNSLLGNTDPNTIYNFNLGWSKPVDISGVTVSNYKVNWSYRPANSVSDVSGSYYTLSAEGNFSVFIRRDILPDASGNSRIGRGAYYTFTVQTVSTDGALSTASAPAYGQGFTRPPIMTKFTATSGNASSQLNWDASYNLSAYPGSSTGPQTGWIYDSSGNYKITVTDPSGVSTNYYTSDSSYNVTGLTNGKTYSLIIQPNVNYFLPTPRSNPANGVQIATLSVTPAVVARSFDATGLLFDAAGPVFESAPVVSQLVNGQYNVRVLVRSDIPMKRVVSLAVAANDSVPHQIIQKSDVNNEIEEGLYEYNFVYDFQVVGALCFATNGADLTTSSPTFPPE